MTDEARAPLLPDRAIMDVTIHASDYLSLAHIYEMAAIGCEVRGRPDLSEFLRKSASNLRAEAVDR